ncbi:conjugal transfer protein [Faecalimonas canis]
MKIGIKREKKEKVQKEKVKHEGLHSKRVIFLWILLGVSLVFAIYKNFTAIDRHTVHEREVVEEKLINTNGIENFVKGFVKEYFSWENTGEGMELRIKKLEEYADEEVVHSVQGMFPAEVTNRSEVYKLDIWNVEKIKDKEYKVTFIVGQKVVSTSGEKKVEQPYETVVYMDKNEDMLITKLPTLTELPKKSDVVLKEDMEAENVEADLEESVNEFLEDFFAVYPTLSDKELKYYAKEGVMPEIHTDSYKFNMLDKFVIVSAHKNQVEVHLTVSYQSLFTNTIQPFEYDLVLEKQDNWKIIEKK